MLVTNAAGTATEWVDKSTATSVSNTSTGNTLSTTVNGKTGTAVNIINTNALTLDGSNKLISTVNGVASSPALDISTAVVATQKTTTLSNGSNTTATGTTTGNVTDYKINVNSATATTTGAVKPGAGLAVDGTGTLSVDASAISTGKALSSNDLTISANGATSLLKDVSIDIKNGAINTAKLADGAVSNVKVGADAITTDKIKDGEVKADDIATGAVTNAKIDTKAVTASKLDAGTGTAGRLAIADATGAVTYSNTIPSGSITGENVTAGSTKVTLGGTPTGAALKAFSVDVNEANLTLSNIGGKITNNQIITGTANQMLVTNAAGTATEWVDKSTATSVSNTSAGNTLSTTVNGKTGTAVNIINTNALTLDASNKLISTVNGVVSSPALDISTAVVATQKTTTLSNGLNTTVAGTTTGNVTDYRVNVATANGTAAGIVKQLATSPVTINSSGELGLNANNGLTVANNNVQLGGALNQATTVTTGTNLLTVATGGNNTMAVTGLQTGAVTDQVVVAGASGILKQVKAAMPKFFYMPSVVIPTAADQFVAETGVSGESFGTMNLYDRYSKQFLTPLKSSPGAPALPIIAKTELYYYVTWYDTTVFTNVQVSATGVLTYTVVPGADVTVGSFMNIVFAVK